LIPKLQGNMENLQPVRLKAQVADIGNRPDVIVTAGQMPPE
jgi:hypothetical protein